MQHARTETPGRPAWFDVVPDDVTAPDGLPRFATVEFHRAWASVTPGVLSRLHRGVLARRAGDAAFAWWPEKEPAVDELPYVLARATCDVGSARKLVVELVRASGTSEGATFFRHLARSYEDGTSTEKARMGPPYLFTRILEDPDDALRDFDARLSEIEALVAAHGLSRTPADDLRDWVSRNHPDDDAGSTTFPTPTSLRATDHEETMTEAPTGTDFRPDTFHGTDDPFVELAADDGDPPLGPSVVGVSGTAFASLVRPDGSDPVVQGSYDAYKATSEKMLVCLDTLRGDQTLAVIDRTIAILNQLKRDLRDYETAVGRPVDVSDLLAEVRSRITSLCEEHAPLFTHDDFAPLDVPAWVDRASVAAVRASTADATGLADTASELANEYKNLVPDAYRFEQSIVDAMKEALGLAQVAKSDLVHAVATLSNDLAASRRDPASAGHGQGTGGPGGQRPERVDLRALVGQVKAKVVQGLPLDDVFPERPSAPEWFKDLLDMLRAGAGALVPAWTSLPSATATPAVPVGGHVHGPRTMPRTRFPDAHRVSTAVLTMADPATAYDQTVRTACEWLRTKAGSLGIDVPEKATEFHGVAPGGAHVIALGSVDDDGPAWAAWYVHPCAEHDGRVWITEMSVVAKAGEVVTGVRLSLDGAPVPEVDPRNLPTVVRKVVTGPGVIDGGTRLSQAPLEFDGPEGYVALLDDRRRRLPVVAVSTGPSDVPPVDVKGLAVHLCGAAHVAKVGSALNTALDASGRADLMVHSGAVKVFPAWASQAKCRLFKPAVVGRMARMAKPPRGLGTFERKVVSEILETSTRTGSGEVAWFDAVEAMTLRRENETVERAALASGEVTPDVVAAHHAETDKLRRDVQDYRQHSTMHEAEEARLLAENAAMWERERALQDEIVRLTGLNDNLRRERQLPVQDVREAVPENWEQFQAFVERRTGDRVVVLPKAMTAARKTRNVDLARLYEGIVFLRDVYVAARRSEITYDEYRERLDGSSFEEAPSLSNKDKLVPMGYVATWKGHRITLDRHLKQGVMDPDKMIRIYFHYEDVCQVAVVGWMPSHLDTDGTN